ncbi:MAG: hypothetical protein JRI97_03425 [Deltaproteobacteria bacterium]|nr:hypothetical protein [Deltaproteobacteria bacterium]
MSKFLVLLRPRLLSVRVGRENHRAFYGKLAFFGALGIGFWAGIFVVFVRVLAYFQAVEGFGDVLAEKLLSMVFTTFFSLLVFSAVFATLSKLYLSRDLPLVLSYPVNHRTVFAARLCESLVDSSWMVAVYILPALFAYGVVYGRGFTFYANAVFVLLPFCVTACAVSALGVMLAVVLLPAGRVRTLLLFLGMGLFLAAYLALRLLRPERLVDPDAFASAIQYLATLRAPAPAWLPSTWAFDSVRLSLSGDWAAVAFHNLLAVSGAAFFVFLAVALAGPLYFKGVSKSQESRVRMPGRKPRSPRRPLASRLPFLSRPARAILVKEIRSFTRDQAQWPQVFLMAALIGIYLYNFKVLPIEKAPIAAVYLENLFSFLNMALAGFVLTALSARFVFPAVSMEKEAFWIVRSSPVPVSRVLWIKFFIYFAPLLVLSEFLIVATNLLLGVTPFMMGLSVATMLLVVPGIVAMGIGLGAAYPNFTSENPMQAVTGTGGLLFMILAAAFIGMVIILEAGPVYAVFMAGIHGSALDPLAWVAITLSFALVAALCAAVVILPMRHGAKKLSPQFPKG